MTKYFFYILFLAALLLACHPKNRENDPDPAAQQEALLRINKYLVEKDADAIRGYIQRHGWKMTETSTGLWYEITSHGAGPAAETGKKVTLEYKLSLLDGTLCYSSDSTGNKTFTLGKGGVETGLEQGVLLLHAGDRARFIMPPHLAYGLIGDENRIPARATIIYEVHLIQITD